MDEYILDVGLLLGVIAAIIAAAGIIVAVAAWLFPRRPKGEEALHRQEARLEIYGTLQQICETLDRLAPKPMGAIATTYRGAEEGLSEFERNGLWQKGQLPSIRLQEPQLDQIEQVMIEKRSLLEDSTVSVWQSVLRKENYGHGGKQVDLEIVGWRKFCADVASNFERLRKQGGT